MSNVAITKKDVLLERETVCPCCTSEIKYILSETNSQYSYCQVCDYDSNTIIKHITFDKIFKSIQKYFTQISRCSINELNISIDICNKSISIYINDENICRLHLSFTIGIRDISILKNIIIDLLEDSFEEGSIKSSVNIYNTKSA